MKSKPKLLLLPNVLDESCDHRLFFPKTVDEAVFTLDGLFAESLPGGRHFLRRFSFSRARKVVDIPILLLNEHTQKNELEELLKPVLEGQTWGIVSDAGLPCFADPGSQLVYLAHQKNIEVEAFVGPSSIVLGLMLSGLSAQNFSFQGYLPKKPEELQKKLKELQTISTKEKMVQIFIETPYRNNKMLETLVHTLQDNTILCVASDITLPAQNVRTLSIKNWKKGLLPDLDKKPAIFLFQSF